MKHETKLSASPLNKKSEYIDQYQPDLLFPLARETNRQLIGVTDPLPFTGGDLWNAYEISWLNPHGKPVVARAQWFLDCRSEFIVESKSIKLYFNSFNHTKFASPTEVQQTISRDLSQYAQYPIDVQLILARDTFAEPTEYFQGEYLDALDVEVDDYAVNPSLLTCVSDAIVTETLYSDLLRSNCLVTNQPDWGSVQIQYTGCQIDKSELLKYIISYRKHNEFHEQCVERMFMDILQHCAPQKLTVYARYTRRGGIDINPIRSTDDIGMPRNIRLFRQ